MTGFNIPVASSKPAPRIADLQKGGYSALYRRHTAQEHGGAARAVAQHLQKATLSSVVCRPNVSGFGLLCK